MKKLPKVYKNNIDKNIKNNKSLCYVKEENTKNVQVSNNLISEQLETIFSGKGYSYNIPVTIKTKNNIYNTSLITKTNNYIVTLDNDLIRIDDITSILINK